MHELIHVVDLESPSETLHQHATIEAAYDFPLVAGYYLVAWPGAAASPCRPVTHYYGPFPTLAQAQMLNRSAWALGLIPDESAIRTVARCGSIGPASLSLIVHLSAPNASRRREEKAPAVAVMEACS